MRQSRVRKNHRNTRGRGRSRRSRRTSSSSSSSSSQYSELGLAGSLVGASALSQGSELEVEFQDQSPSFIGGRGRSSSAGAGRKPGCANDIAGHILCFLELLNTIKIYHWSTLSYPTHKATDELHDTLSKLVDSFIEIYIGHCARGGVGAGAAGAGSGVPVFKFKSEKDSCISFCQCKTHDAFCKILDENIIHLEGLTDKLNGYTDLVNIRDEMVGALAQALYLLRLN
jgi:hypothetical protein